jgi:hypothetical protein
MKGRPSPQVGKRIRLCDPPGRGIRDADVEHLAYANQIIQRSHDFFDWRHLIPDVDPVEIDVVGLQSFEARFHCLHHVLALIAGRVLVRTRNGIGVFRGHHHALAVALHKLAEEGFARPVRVHVRGVDEIAPGLAESVVHLSCLILCGTPAPLLTEGHGAERCLRNLESAVAQKSVSHMRLLVRLYCPQLISGQLIEHYQPSICRESGSLRCSISPRDIGCIRS